MADEFTKAALYGIKTFNKKVKEKFWIAKLIELLNEYRTEKGERNLNEFEVSQTLDSLNYLRLFIKWLVENDKINFSNTEFYFLEREQYTKEESILMLLSISSSPIEDLVSYLK